ncbi:unnamed protein product [Vitrella brassicaformis CCMP3155]|uniref:Glycogen debranching enzyme n=2 Tax=Vitrella brassicaformis TaxID=1169539 RepID=A0A0G4G102_VITBC|nr:unnamed protein product [Vitrella brassicaformis CCMP3155]|mmetsp:Transcript_36417/g.90970  ORF Transcript_36417/g.90970 Transcript_36417/m.90970 type:complete len:1744 (+) Transcript_36417:326-5557(+)|eukprot:CEM21760.1 unnamed protein product [Vitrella brassicaformis CCMP3155]
MPDTDGDGPLPPTEWKVQFDESGGFLRENGAHGNFRIRNGDTINMWLPAGFPLNQQPCLNIEDPIGKVSKDEGSSDELGNWYCTFTAATPGPYVFKLTATEFDSKLPREGPETNLIVEPVLKCNGKAILPNAIVMQSVMSRCMGRIRRWPRMIKSPAELNYNMIHFTPVQKTGESGSCYSLADQNAISDEFFHDAKSVPDAERMKALKEAISQFEKEHGVLSTIDIVLNHTANNSPWVAEHPECGYTVHTAPHLTAALELDEMLAEFSLDILAHKHVKKYGINEHIDTEEKLTKVISAMRVEVLEPFKMLEWYTIDVKTTLANFENAKPSEIVDFDVYCTPGVLAPPPPPPPSHEDPHPAVVPPTAKERQKEYLKQELIKTLGVKRNAMTVPGEVSRQVCASKAELSALLEAIQAELTKAAAESVDFIQGAIQGYARWERLEQKKGPLGDRRWELLAPRYFSYVTAKDGTKTAVANNGWVMGWDATKDFGAAGSLVYLRRELCAWTDCIKLRYGSSPESCPFLWQWMEKYVKGMAEIFHGVRLDNCHSTPIHVAKHMLRAARSVRSDLFVYAELFTGVQATDLHFEGELGLNALIREAMQTWSPGDLAAHVIKYGGRCVGAFSPIPAKDRHLFMNSGIAGGGGANNAGGPSPHPVPLHPSMATALFFDCTHDNETMAEKRTPAEALPTAAFVAASVCATGSTRGFDELVPHHLNVVLEHRIHQDFDDTPDEDFLRTPPKMSPFATKDLPPEQVNEDEPVEQPKDTLEETPEDDPFHMPSTGPGAVPKSVARSVPTETTTTGKKLVNGKEGPTAATERLWDKRVTIRWQRGGRKVQLVGSWDSWTVPEPMTAEGDGLFKCDLYVGKQLPTDAEEFQFKFVVDGCWQIDESQPAVMADDGNINNVIRIGGRPTSSRAWLPGDELVGIMAAKRVLNDLHYQMGQEGYDEMYLDLMAEDLTVIQRHSPKTHSTIYFVIRSAFWWPHEYQKPLPEILIPGRITTLHLAAHLFIPKEEIGAFRRDPIRINGMRGKMDLYHKIDDIARTHIAGPITHLWLDKFPPGSVLVFSAKGWTEVRQQVEHALPSITEVMKGVPLTSISRLLYSCDNEEKDRTYGKRGVYDVPGHGPLPYCGICGVIPILEEVRRTHNLNHPLCVNVREGDWMLDYLAERLFDTPELQPIGQWVRDAWLAPRESLPAFLRPTYFDWVMSTLYGAACAEALSQMSPFVSQSKDEFVTQLAIATLQFYSHVPSAPLVWETNMASLCAGLPHFSSGFMRNWGRDTFISLPGCLLVTGRLAAAKQEILGYARVLRHALIPNLLDAGNNPRYNARDATWFFMQAIQEYCQLSPEGVQFLLTPVTLKYPLVPNSAPISNLADLVHHILQQCAQGIEYREWNAGKGIDEHMTDEGFNVKIRMNPDTGMIYGGNQHNCGTWMDKMGSSEKAGNKGVPATPRDGAAVEIIGLLKSALRFVSSLPEDVFPYKTVTLSNGNEVLYKKWNTILEASFEKIFYVPSEEEQSDIPYYLEEKWINRRMMYKDSHKASSPWCDYQLRPNICIAMSVAPEMFSENHAKLALHTIESILMGDEKQLGIKTLDPSDLNYRGVYDNANDGEDKSVAHGFNYHQGPEWVWPVGYFLMAKLAFLRSINSPTISPAVKWECMRHLKTHRKHIVVDPWMSLPELTNESGSPCHFSCPAQAWSIATLLAFMSSLADKNGSTAVRQNASAERPKSPSKKAVESANADAPDTA